MTVGRTERCRGWIDIQNCQFEGDTFWDAQPVEADERWSNVF